MIHICLDLVSNGCFGNSKDSRVKDMSEVRERTEQCIAIGGTSESSDVSLHGSPKHWTHKSLDMMSGGVKLLEGHGPAVFSSNPAPIYFPVVFK